MLIQKSQRDAIPATTCVFTFAIQKCGGNWKMLLKEEEKAKARQKIVNSKADAKTVTGEKKGRHFS